MLIEKIDREQINILVKIHNENFDTKINKNYFDEIFENKNYKYFLLNKEKMIVGYIIFYDTTDGLDLFELAIDKDFQGRGFGGELLSKSLSHFFNEKIFLEVNEKNQKAINLYRKNGFLQIAVRKNYYGANENGIIMLRDKK